MLYIYFCQGKHCLRRFLKKGYYHCNIVIDYGQDLILVEPTNSFLSIRLMKDAYKEALVNLCKYWKATEIIAVKTDLDNSFRELKLRCTLFTCVGLIKYLLGINKWWIFSPYQLAKYLKNGKLKQINLKEVINGTSTKGSNS